MQRKTALLTVISTPRDSSIAVLDVFSSLQMQVVFYRTFAKNIVICNSREATGLNF